MCLSVQYPIFFSHKLVIDAFQNSAVMISVVNRQNSKTKTIFIESYKQRLLCTSIQKIPKLKKTFLKYFPFHHFEGCKESMCLMQLVAMDKRSNIFAHCRWCFAAFTCRSLNKFCLCFQMPNSCQMLYWSLQHLQYFFVKTEIREI